VQKKTIRKITLSRETLLQLEDGNLQQALGGIQNQEPTFGTRCFVC
jgi:flagellar biosynthesis component FlhA